MTGSSRGTRGSGKNEAKRTDNKQNDSGARRPRRGGPRKRRGRGSPVTTDLPYASPAMRQILSAPLDKGHYIIFDIETTGGNPDKNGITEIFALKFHDGQIGETFYSLVNPGIPIPPIVRRMTGINNKMLKDQPKIDEVIPKFMEFVGDDIFVSHNTIGDMKFIRYFAEKVTGVMPENFFLCTHLLVEKLVSEAPDKSLKGLAEFFKFGTGELHRAEADTYVTLELFKVLQQRLRDRSVEKIEQAIRLQGDLESGMRLGWAVPSDRLRNVPSGPGIFYLHDHQDQVLFMSSAVHLDREVRKLSHFVQLPRQLLRQALKAYDLKVKKCPNLFQAMLEEAEYMQGSTLKFGPDAWHQRVYQALCLSRTKDGELRVTVGGIDPGAFCVYGPVKDRKTLCQQLDEVAKLFGTSFTRKGMVVPGDAERALMGWLEGSLDQEVKTLAKERRAVRFWFSPKKRQELTRRLGVKEKLIKIPPPLGMENVLPTSGVIAVPVGNERWQLHGLANSRLVGIEREVSGDLDMAVHEEKAKLAQIVGDQVKKTAQQPVAPQDVDKVNAALWWVYSTKWEGKFFSFADLIKTDSP